VAPSRSVTPLGLRALAIACVAVAASAISAEPAAAHGAGGVEPSNYETIVDGVRPPVPGVRVRPVDVGTALELRNTSARDVVVLGYEDEPYLRVGPRGAFENARSPAVFLNRQPNVSGRVPASYDAAARPRWRRIGEGDVVRWHDHRAHWMGDEEPAAVARDPGATHVVLEDWAVPIRAGATRAEIRGDTRYVPPSGAWPWVGVAAGLAVAVIALGRTRWWARVLVVSLGAVLLTEAVHLVGSWGATTDGALAKVGAGIYSIAGLAIGVLALWWLLRRDPWNAAPLVLVAGLFLFIAGGLADVTSLTRSQLPSTLEPWLARLTVAAALGLGLGLMVVAATRLRPPARPPGDVRAHPEPVGAAT
jgi:hypothetical protein